MSASDSNQVADSELQAFYYTVTYVPQLIYSIGSEKKISFLKDFIYLLF